MALNPDGERCNSSPLLRQILQPLPDTEIGTRAESGGDSDGDDNGDDNNDDNNDDDDDADDDADDVGGGDGDGGSPNDHDDAVAENVVSIVDGMGLDESEAAALRLAIASGDANIRGALELFR